MKAFYNKNDLGRRGEEYACIMLSKNNYKILERNFRCSFGEIDIIALDKETLVFIEVKTRNSGKFGLPQEAVNKKKLENIRKVGEIYLKKSIYKYKKLRIDVVSIIVKEGVPIYSKIIKVL